MTALLHSVRFRLTLWYALVLALVLSIFSAVLYGVVRYARNPEANPARQAAVLPWAVKV